MSDQQTDVLIVGAGPVGIITAIMLDRLGVACQIIERRTGLHSAPQAHVISSRSLEICRSLGIDDRPIRALGPNPMDTASVRWVDRLIGRDLGVFSMASNPNAVMRMFAQTPTPITNLAQDRFEQVLADHLPDSLPIRFGHKWIGMTANGDGYVSQIEGAHGETFEISSKFIIGADGAGSRVRAAIGAEMEGPHHIQNYVNVHFHANLRDQLSGREGLLYWVMDPECAGVFIAHEIDHNWIFMKTTGADVISEGIDEGHYAGLLRKAIGADVDLDIQSMATWVMTAQVSSAYQKQGVFLVGDAGHRFPPTGGIGMNTGFQDAHNLTWKLAMVLNGFDRKLLETYEAERRPSAVANSKQSHQNFLNMSLVDEALDVDRDGVPSMADFDRVMDDGERQAEVQKAIDEQAAHFNMSGLDLGVCYRSSGILTDGSPPVSGHPISEYVPSTTPGARLPHCWLQRNGERLSTLDLVKSSQLLLISFQQTNDEIEKVVEGLKQDGFPMQFVSIHIGDRITPDDEQFDDLFSDDEVLLVRPDGHVAARLTRSTAASDLPSLIKSILGTPNKHGACAA